MLCFGDLGIPWNMATIDGPAGDLRYRKSNGAIKSNGSANGHANGESNGHSNGIANRQSSDHTKADAVPTRKANGMPTEHGREVDRRMDEHHS